MKFNSEYPKKEITIETTKEVGSLIADHKSVVHYRNYRGYLDSVNYITLTGDKSVWYGIKSDFLYDTLTSNVKEFYCDGFGRKMTVKIINE
tara:strand:- start:1039 stop:1311 length:273 start_codon:yes stop_codon:yes gene_type:complete